MEEMVKKEEEKIREGKGKKRQRVSEKEPVIQRQMHRIGGGGGGGDCMEDDMQTAKITQTLRLSRLRDLF